MVTSENVKLQLRLQPEFHIPKNALVELTLPSGGEVSFTPEALASTPKCSMLTAFLPTDTPCKITKSGDTQLISWNFAQEFKGNSGVIFFELSSGFNNPKTSEATGTFVMKIFTDQGQQQVLAFQDSDLNIKAEVGELSQDDAFFEVAPGGTGVVGEPTAVILNIKASLVLQPNSVIQIDFPKHSVFIPNSLQKGYVVED